MTRARIEAPQLFSGDGIQGKELSLRIAGEDQVAAGRHRRGQQGVLGVVAPFLFPGHRIEGVEMAAGLALGGRLELEHPSEKGLARPGVFLLHGEGLTPLDSGVVEQPRLGAVGRVVPASSAPDGRAHQDGLPHLGLLPSQQLPGRIDPLDPVDVFGEAPGIDELAVGPVQDPGVPALVGIDQQLAFLAVDRQVDQHAFVGGIPVPDVVGNLLVVPLQFPAVGIQGHDAIGIEIVSGPVFPVEVGGRIAHPPVDQVQLRIVGARHPGGAAAIFPTVALPGFVALFSWPGDGPEPPGPPAGPGVEGVQIAPMGRVAPGDPDHDLVLDHQGRARDVAAALLHALDLDVPDLLPCLGVQRHQAVVDRPHEDQAVAQGHPPVPGAIEEAELLGLRMVIVPKLLAGDGIQREDPVPGGGDIHHPIRHQGGAGKASIHLAGLKDPGRRQPLHVLPIDLIQRAVAPGVIGPRINQPVLRLPGRLDQALGIDGFGRGDGTESNREQQKD